MTSPVAGAEPLAGTITDPQTGQLLAAVTRSGVLQATAVQTPGVIPLDSFTGTDDQKMAAAISAAITGGGGVIVLAARVHTFAAQWSTPENLAATTGITITGTQSSGEGEGGTQLPMAGPTIVNFTYPGTGVACLDIRHSGKFELAGICFTMSAGVTVPFIQVTNAVAAIHDCQFTGLGTQFSCVTDAIVFGGGDESAAPVGGPASKADGYGTWVWRCQFHNIRRACLLRHGANGWVITGNYVDSSCGNLYGGAFELYDVLPKSSDGNILRDNYVELIHYQCAVKVTAGLGNVLGPNTFWDNISPDKQFLACYVLDAASGGNRIIDGYRPSTAPLMLDLGGTSAAESNVNSGYSTDQPAVRRVLRSADWSVLNSAGVMSQDKQGDRGGIVVSLNTPPYPRVFISAASCTQVADAITYAGSRNVVSITAAWTISDLGTALFCTGLPNFCLITGVWTHSAAPVWQPAAAYALGDAVIPAGGNGHLYQCTTAGTSDGTQPAFPADGSTITDGTAAWTDLGTAATLAVVTGPCTVTATGVTVSFGRVNNSMTMTSFHRHHIVSSGTAPAWTPGAGAGTGAAVAVAAGSSDLSQEVTVTTGTTPAAGVLATGAAALSFSFRAPKVALTPRSAAAAGLGAYITSTTNGWTLSCANAPAAATVYAFDILSLE